MGSDTSSDETAAGAGAEVALRKGLRGAIGAALPKERFGDHLTILSGTGQNILGLGVFVVASFVTSLLVAHFLGLAALGTVTLTTQFAFVGGAATRFGMDMAAVRRVAIDVGQGQPGRARAVMNRAALIALAVSAVAAVAIVFAAGPLAHAFAPHGTSASGGAAAARDAFRAAALALPFVALAQVYLGGTRGLKIMRHTLWIYWTGQPLAWIGLMVGGWAVSKTIGMSVLAYAGSWFIATIAAWFVWGRETRAFEPLPPAPGEVRELVRYGAPRAPAALLSQLLFWTDYFVFSRYAHGLQLGVYAAAVRVAQALVLFLIAVNYMFSPFVADLHARGERDRLNGLYKALTRWTLAGTIPLLLLLAIVPGPVLVLFGAKAETGTAALRILLIGQAINVAVGSVGFILIMVGRTGWDLAVYLSSFVLDLTIAFILAPRLGMEGAATAQAVTLIVANAARLYLVWRFVRIQPFSRYYFRLAIPAAAGAAMMLAAHLALAHTGRALDLLGSALAGGVAYGVILLLAGLTPTERGAIRRVLARSQ